MVALRRALAQLSTLLAAITTLSLEWITAIPIRSPATHIAAKSEGHDREMAIQYLAEFGYLKQAPSPSHRELTNAIKTFQDMVKVKQTGRLDHETLRFMMQPRCGNGDVSRRKTRRRKRFEDKAGRLAVAQPLLENKVRDGVLKLRWFIDNYTKDMPRAEIKKAVKGAFHLWSSQVSINAMESLELMFEEAQSESEADVTILWAEGDHGDAHKFDGPGLDGSNILAHTFYPNYQSRGTLNGDIHLDDYEVWTLNGTRDGASFFHVLVHEIGHTLGLGHSKKQQAIMYPIYKKEHTDLMQLDLDDKCAVNWSYVGATDLCLYIWLLSEVLPKKVAIEREQQQSPYLVSNSVMAEQRTEEGIRARFVNAKVPLCRDENLVKEHIARMLRQRLSFPKQLAGDYSDIVCHFFDGIHREYGAAGSEDFHEVMRIHGSHSYTQVDPSKFNNLRQALEENSVRRTFDCDFFASPPFQWILSQFDS